jgi:hypothetical protein
VIGTERIRAPQRGLPIRELLLHLPVRLLVLQELCLPLKVPLERPLLVALAQRLRRQVHLDPDRHLIDRDMVGLYFKVGPTTACARSELSLLLRRGAKTWFEFLALEELIAEEPADARSVLPRAPPNRVNKYETGMQSA